MLSARDKNRLRYTHFLHHSVIIFKKKLYNLCKSLSMAQMKANDGSKIGRKQDYYLNASRHYTSNTLSV